MVVYDDILLVNTAWCCLIPSKEHGHKTVILLVCKAYLPNLMVLSQFLSAIVGHYINLSEEQLFMQFSILDVEDDEMKWHIETVHLVAKESWEPILRKCKETQFYLKQNPD